MKKIFAKIILPTVLIASLLSGCDHAAMSGKGETDKETVTATSQEENKNEKEKAEKETAEKEKTSTKDKEKESATTDKEKKTDKADEKDAVEKNVPESGTNEKPETGTKTEEKTTAGTTPKPTETGGNTTSGSSGGSSGGSSQKPSTPTQAPVHTHSWTTINHPEQGHYETVTVQEAWEEPEYGERDVFVGYGPSICNSCGQEWSGEHGLYWAEQGDYSHGSYHADPVYEKQNTIIGYIKHPAVTEQRWVVDSAAWSEKVCSSCGAKG